MLTRHAPPGATAAVAALPGSTRPRPGPSAAAQRRRIPPRGRTALGGALLVLLLTALAPHAGMAHESWILTPEHIAELDARPRPELFVRLIPVNAAMLALAAS